jgi:biofilm protein TabA
MRTQFSRFLLLVFLLSAIVSNTKSFAQSDNASLKKSTKWYNSRVWLNGLQLTPHKSVDKAEFIKQYNLRKEWWDKAFAYLKETDLKSLTPGKHLIDGENVFATVTEGPTKDMEQTKWEAHRNYLDIHYVITGKEKMGIAPFSTATVVQEYDPAKDIGFYNAKGKFYDSSPGSFFIAFPSDAHRPGVKTEGSTQIKKVVVKIRVAS